MWVLGKTMQTQRPTTRKSGLKRHARGTRARCCGTILGKLAIQQPLHSQVLSLKGACVATPASDYRLTGLVCYDKEARAADSRLPFYVDLSSPVFLASLRPVFVSTCTLLSTDFVTNRLARRAHPPIAVYMIQRVRRLAEYPSWMASL